MTIGSDAQSPPSIIITLPDGRAGIFVESSNSHTGDIVVTLHLVKIIQNNLNTVKEGILVQQRGSGSAVVTTGSYTELGADGTNLDGPGIYVWISPSTSAQLKIVNNGNIFTNHEGIKASHNSGMGNIDITHGGTIKAQKEGIWAYHGGGGKIIITNDGSIVSTNSGIFARHYGTGGGVEIVSSEDIETTGASKPGIYVETRHASATGTVTVKVEDGVIKSTSHGVEVRSKGLGPVILELLADGSIGISNERVGGNGINAMIQNPANTEDLTIKSNGKIFSRGAGILASRNGAGDVDINHGGAINSMDRGISAEHKGAGAIKIRITQEGSIEAQGYGIWAYHDGTGKIVITNDGSIVSTDSGIYARHNGRYGGVDGTEGGVEIVSSGDIETTGVSKPGIYVVTRDASATGTVKVKVADGEIKSTGDGVRVQSQGLGPVTVELLADGSIGISNERVGGNGISAMIQNTANTEDLTIKSSGKIFSAGDGISASHTGEGAVDINHVGAIDSMGRGISAEHSGSGAIKIRITPEGSIEAQGYGIRVYRSGTGKIVITNDGGIVSTDSGIYARHDGTAGSVEIVSRGDIETTGTSKPGIQVDTTRSTASTDKVEVKVEDGEIKSTGDGVRVQSKGLGPVIVELLADGSIGISNERVGGNGINVMIQNEDNNEDLTIKSSGEIFSEGDGISASHTGEGAVDINHGSAIDSMGLGISAEHSGSGAIKIRITPEGSIEAQGYGIRVYRGGTGKIVITNDGSIVSTGYGIYARHNGRYGGVDGTEGGVEIVSRGDIETTGDTNKPGIYVETRDASATGTVKVHVEDGVIKSTGDGVRVQSKGLGPVIIELLADGSIGISNERVGGNGINAMIQNPANTADLTIKSNGKIFSEGDDGIVATHIGEGAVKINHGGAIDSMGRGISAQHSGSGAIEIRITPVGSIEAQGYGIRAYRSGTGNIVITNEGSIVSTDSGIIAQHGGAGGSVVIVSRGNIETTGTSKKPGIEVNHLYDLPLMMGLAAQRPGTTVDTSSTASTDKVEVKVEDGEIKSTGDGVRVRNQGLGPVTVELLAKGSIGISGERVGGNGINVMIQNEDNNEDLTIKSSGEIFSKGDGIVASHNGGGAVKINHGGAIDSMGRGISAQHSGSGAIEINQLGRIKSGTAGIYTRHLDTGIIKIINEGDIDSMSFGIQAYRGGAGKIDIEHSGNIVSKDFGIFARHDGVGAADGSGIKITSWGNIRTTGYRRAGIDAQGRRKDATSNIEVRHEEGEIESHVGISVRSARSSGSTYEYGPAAANGADPLPPQALKVIVSGGKIKARKMPYDPNLDEAKSKHQVGWKVRSLITTFDGPTGITVGTMDAQGIGEYIAAGDIPESYDPTDPWTIPTDAELDALITDAVRTQFRAVLKAALNFNKSPGNELNLGNLFDPRNIVVVPDNPIISDLSNDDDLDAYLKANGGAVLLKFLKYTLSEKEAALVEAVFKKKGLDAALSALPDSYAAEYRNQVKWFAKSYNSANIEVRVEGGRVESEGDGIRTGYTLVHDKNGKIRIYVQKGAKVIGDRYGIWVNGAGIDDRGTPDQSDDIRDQTVEVQGTVESTGPDGAGVYLSGGGTLIIGTDGKVSAASGTSVIANDPGFLRLVIETKKGESPTDAVKRALKGIIVNEIGRTELVFVAHDGIALPSATGVGSKNAVIDGALDVGLSAVNGGVQIVSNYAPRSRVYEALPSVLLGLNDILDLQERVHAPRMPNGMWGRLGSKSGFRDLVNSTSRTSYKHRRHSLDTGWDIPLDDGGTFGISVHHRIGAADVSRGGSIDVSGSGLGISRTWVANDFHVDVQAATTWYDADLASSVRGNLKSGLSGIGYVFGIEVGNRMEVNDLSVSPNVGLVHSSVKLNDFTDALGLKVTPHTARSLKARLGVGIAEMKERNSSAGRLFGSLRLEREFSGETGITVAGTDLSSTNRSTALHLGAGIVFDSSDGSSLRAGVNYQTDGRSHEIGGALTLHF